MRPKAVRCSVCGELIIPYMESGKPCYDCFIVNDEHIHRTCFDHGSIWRRIRSLEGRVKELEDKNDEEKK